MAVSSLKPWLWAKLKIDKSRLFSDHSFFAGNRADEQEQFLLGQPMNDRPNIELIPTGEESALPSSHSSFHTLTSVFIFPVQFSVHLLICWQGSLFNNHEVLQFIIISFILMTLMFDSGVILKGEIR